MTEPQNHEAFVPYVGRSVRFKGWHGSLTLARIETHPPTPASPRVPFSLLFSGLAGDVLPEGLYNMQVEDGPVVALYIMPIHTPSRGRQDYQSVFN